MESPSISRRQDRRGPEDENGRRIDGPDPTTSDRTDPPARFYRWFYDPRARMSYLVPEAFAVLGLNRLPGDRMPWTIWRRIIHPADLARVRRQAKAMQAGEPQILLYRVVRPCDGALRWIESFGLEQVREGENTRVIGVLRDVTGRENARQHDAQLRALGFAAAGVGHDFKGVLQAIVSNTEVVIAAAAGCDAVRMPAERILRSVERGIAVVRRLEAGLRGTGAADRGGMEIGPILHALCQEVSARFGDSLDVRIRIAPDLPRFDLPRGDFEAALLNILNNACDALGGAGCITVSARPTRSRARRHVTIEVRDEGPGMERMILDRALDPFFTTKPAGAGTGLGLPLARDFARRHGGDLTIRSAPGQGAVVTLRLPLGTGRSCA